MAFDPTRCKAEVLLVTIKLMSFNFWIRALLVRKTIKRKKRICSKASEQPTQHKITAAAVIRSDALHLMVLSATKRSR